MQFWVYMLRCADGSYYVGQTDSLERRIAGHEAGDIPGYTAARLPVALVWAETFDSRVDAVERERQVKRWSRAKKEALLNGDWPRLRELSKGAPYQSPQP